MPNQTLTPSPVPALRKRFEAVPWLPILLSPRGPYMAQTDAQGIPLRDDRGSLHVEETPGGVSGAWRRGAQVIANLVTVRKAVKVGKIEKRENPKEADPCVYGLSYPK